MEGLDIMAWDVFQYHEPERIAQAITQNSKDFLTDWMQFPKA